MRVNSAKAMVSSAKYTPPIPKRKASTPIAAPAAMHARTAAQIPSQGGMPKCTNSAAETYAPMPT